MSFLKMHLKWIYPGLKIKRWLFLALIGLIIASFGIALIFEAKWWIFLFYIGVFLEEQFISYTSVLAVSLLLIGLGGFIISFSLRQGTKSIMNAVLPDKETKLVDVIYEKRYLERGPKVVVIGGGTGSSVLLRGLKLYTSNITALVTVTDDGGCSGKLRGQLGILPPGDLRNNLVALADKESLLENLLNYRFPKGSDLEDRNLGNLLIAAMTDTAGDMNIALQQLSKVLAIRGTVMPSTLNNVVLKAVMEDGSEVYGETEIVKKPGRIKRIHLIPDHALPVDEAIKAIYDADAVILGPGSLYTSIIPNLLIKEISHAVTKSKAKVYYICNVMTQPGETDNYSVGDHLKAIKENAKGIRIDKVIVNHGTISTQLSKKYRDKGAFPVKNDEKRIRKLGVEILKADLVNHSDLIRHNSDKLAKILIKEITKEVPAKDRFNLFKNLSRKK